MCRSVPCLTGVSPLSDRVIKVLCDIIHINQLACGSNPTPSPFTSFWMFESMPFELYAERLIRGSRFSEECIVMAFCILRRLEKSPFVPLITQRSIHRMFFTSIILAYHMLEDVTYSNHYLARVGCIALPDLFNLQFFAFKCLGMSCLIPDHEYFKCVKEINQYIIFSPMAQSSGQGYNVIPRRVFIRLEELIEQSPDDDDDNTKKITKKTTLERPWSSDNFQYVTK
eukprot:c19781_g1_i1.p1 GENE.c19781_g1_i1~~c19781_g1_i1.p1  ORF type:complete len:260 (+),score=36.25 c19781_g1_i1:100-780(+)